MPTGGDRRRRGWLAAAGIVAILAAAGLWRSGSRAPAPSSEVRIETPPPAPPASPEPATAACHLGVVVASAAVEVPAEREGTVVGVGVEVGERVPAGHVLAELDTEALRQQLAIERAERRSVEAARAQRAIEVERSAQVRRRREALDDLLSPEEKEAARARHDTAELELDAADAALRSSDARIQRIEQALGRSRIQAPFAGIVAQRYVDAGAWVRPGSPVARLLRDEGTLVRFAVPPAAVPGLTVGRGLIVVTAAAEPSLAAEVERISPEIDAASQMVFVEARLVRADSVLPPVAFGAEVRVWTGSGAPAATCRPPA